LYGGGGRDGDRDNGSIGRRVWWGSGGGGGGDGGPGVRWPLSPAPTHCFAFPPPPHPPKRHDAGQRHGIGV